MKNKIRSNRTIPWQPSLRPLTFLGLLPGTNCKKCEEPSCLAFAVKLVGRDIEIIKCDPLFSEKYQAKRNVLFDLLHAAGFEIHLSF